MKMPVVYGGRREISSSVPLSWPCWKRFASSTSECISAAYRSPDIQGLSGSQGHLHALEAEKPGTPATNL